VSSFDRTGRNRDAIQVPVGATATLADIPGSGIIRHIWVTIAIGGKGWDIGDPLYMRKITLRMYWDGMDHPSVEVPIGDFFGVGHAAVNSFNTAVMNMSHISFCGERAALNCYWPMPFSNGAKITIHNECDYEIVAFYYYIDYDILPTPPDNMGRFHAWWNRNNPCRKPKHIGDDPDVNLSDKDNYLIADIRGRGHFVGCNLSIHNLYGGWWGEGDDMFMVDGDKWPPDLHGTGSEDYFSHAWGMQVQNAFLYNGVSYHKKGSEPGAINERITVYRYHVNDPVVFHKSLRASIEHGHANDRCDDYSSTAYWYQTLPHKRFPKYPKVEDRLPRPDVKIHAQGLDLPLPITDGRHHSGMPFMPMDIVPQKQATKTAGKKSGKVKKTGKGKGKGK